MAYDPAKLTTDDANALATAMDRLLSELARDGAFSKRAVSNIETALLSGLRSGSEIHAHFDAAIAAASRASATRQAELADALESDRDA